MAPPSFGGNPVFGTAVCRIMTRAFFYLGCFVLPPFHDVKMHRSFSPYKDKKPILFLIFE
jgi:hypothetical protein